MNDASPIAVIQKNSRETLRIELSEFKGHRLVNARIWAGDGAAAVPTKNGWSIRIDLLSELRESLDRAEAEAKRLGWIGGAT